MSEEFESLNSRIPDFASALMSRVNGQRTTPVGTFDPYKAILNKKNQTDSGTPPPTVQYPEEDVKALADYCTKMGIFGFNTRLHPRLALAQLKKQFGEDFSGIPLDERIPSGYQKIGTKSQSDPTRRQVIHG